MTYLEAAILGLVQGLGEFLPISSSGHLALLQQWFGIEENNILLFTILLHFGTLVSVVIVYRKDIWALIVELFKTIVDLFTGKGLRLKENPLRKFGVMIVVATIPTTIIGLLFDDFFNSLYKSLFPIGISFIITGILLMIGQNIKNNYKSIDDMSIWNALLIGTVQGCAITPGISRSGSTLFASLISKLDRDFAVKFVFILSIPPICGSLILELPDALEMGFSNLPIPQIAVGVFVAMISGLFAIKTMIKVVSKKSLNGFSYYLWILGLIVIAYSLYKFI